MLHEMPGELRRAGNIIMHERVVNTIGQVVDVYESLLDRWTTRHGCYASMKWRNESFVDSRGAIIGGQREGSALVL